MVLRQARDSIEEQRLAIVAALYSNPNWDDEQNERPARLKELNDHFNRAIEALYNPDLAKEDEHEIDWDNPFWAATKRGLEKTMALLPQQQEASNVRQLFDEEQTKAREKSRKEIDQL